MAISPIIAGYFLEWNISPFYLAAGSIAIGAVIALTVLEKTVEKDAIVEPEILKEKPAEIQ
jgi:hypothetical protein